MHHLLLCRDVVNGYQILFGKQYHRTKGRYRFMSVLDGDVVGVDTGRKWEGWKGWERNGEGILRR